MSYAALSNSWEAALRIQSADSRPSHPRLNEAAVKTQGVGSSETERNLPPLVPKVDLRARRSVAGGRRRQDGSSTQTFCSLLSFSNRLPEKESPERVADTVDATSAELRVERKRKTDRATSSLTVRELPGRRQRSGRSKIGG